MNTEPECTCTWGPVHGPAKALAQAIGAVEEIVEWDPNCLIHMKIGPNAPSPGPIADLAQQQAELERLIDEGPGPCPHQRPIWSMCPHCLGLNRK